MAAKWRREDVLSSVTYATTYLGYTKLKPPQEEIITEYVLAKDVFVSLPTGFGKRICYGCLPIVFDKLRGLDKKSIALIITPLISLMTDQVSSFTSKGLKAGFIGTGMNKKTVDAVMNGQYQLLFISPEALLESRRWRDILREEPYTSTLKHLQHTKSWSKTNLLTEHSVGWAWHI